MNRETTIHSQQKAIYLVGVQQVKIPSSLVKALPTGKLHVWMLFWAARTQAAPPAMQEALPHLG